MVLHKVVCGPPQQEFTLQPMPHQFLLLNPLCTAEFVCIVNCIVNYIVECIVKCIVNGILNCIVDCTVDCIANSIVDDIVDYIEMQ